jgi:hypothetical protein
MSAWLTVWAVYDHPIDMPEHFVARRYEAIDDESHATDDVLVADTLQALREQLPPGLTRVPKHPGDDLRIVELWL